MDFKKLIKVADVFGTETRKLAELREGELADRMRNELDWSEEDAEEIEDAVIATGNDPAEMASAINPTSQPTQQTNQGPFLDGMVITPDIQERLTAIGRDRGINGERLSPEDIQALNNGVQSGEITAPSDIDLDNDLQNAQPAAPRGEEPATVSRTSPQPPATPTLDEPPQADTAPPSPPSPQGDSAADVAQDDAARRRPQGDSAADVAQDDAARAQGGDALAGRLDTQTPSLLDAYNDGGRKALDSVRDLQTALSRLGFDPNGIDGKYGRGTYGAVQEFQRQNGLQVDGEAGPITMAKLQELLNSSAGQDQPQSDPAVDAETDDTARQAPQTDAELDADAADTRQAGVPDAERDSRERGVQTASKEFNMKKYIKESRELDECGTMPPSMPQREGNPVTMSVTLNASGEQHVQDLIRMMQLAGAKDAAPVSAMHVGPSVDKHDDMVSMMRMMDTPEESVEEEWDNAPEEDYRDHKHMTKDLSGGLNREKKAYAKAQDGDNAMAVESIKAQLLQALEEAGYKK